MDERTRSELCAPLKIGEDVIGVINAESSRLNAFTKEDENLIDTMAAQIAIAIQRLRTAEIERHQTAQLIRSNALIRILAHVGTRAAAAPNPEGVMRILGDELAKIGLVCLIALPRDPKYMAVAYTSMPNRLVRYIERLAKHPMSEFLISYERLIAYSGRDPKPELLKDPLVITNNVLANFPSKVAYRILRPAGASEVMPLCHLPLMTEGKLNGILWLWGEGLRENDLPMLSIFASQVATAIQNARLMAEVHRLAIMDEGTGIFNRRHFFQLAEQEFSRARRYKHSLSAIIVDVDEFKAFNDHYGHIIGDLVLRQVAQTLKNTLREGDILGRYGGEEFSILLPSADAESARKVADRLCEQVAIAGVATEHGTLAVSVSIGVAELKPEMSTLLTLVDIADQAMYCAKQAGGNRAFVK
jgi:diguanylate cyclase (GGDEF)-like protein